MDANMKYARLTGHRDIDQILGKSVLDWTAPHDRERFSRELMGCLKKGFVRNIEIDHADAKGRPTPVEINVTRIGTGRRNSLIAFCRDISKELHSELEKPAVFADSVPFALMVIDKQGNFKYINEKFNKIFGYELQDIPDARTWFRKAYPDREYRHKVISTWAEDIESFMQDGKSGDTRRCTFTTTCRDGAPKAINFIPVQLSTGDTLISCEDLTGLVKAHKDLESERSTFFSILENLPLGIVLADHFGDCMFVNAHFTNITGYTLNDVPTGRDWLVKAYPDPEHRKKVAVAWKKDRLPGSTYEAAECRINCKNGQVKVISFQATRLKDFTIIVLRDTTARKQIESALKRNEDKYRSIYENAIEGIFRSAPDGRFLSANPAHARMLGYDSSEEMIRDITDLGRQLFVDPGDHRYFKELMETQGIVEKFETRLYRKDGGTIWVSLNARAARNDNGETIYHEGTAEDITARKLMEEEKIELEARLRQSEKMEAIGKLAGGIAHDFNNILAVLLGHSGILKIRIPKDDPLQARVKQIIDTIEKASSFTKSLLAFSRKQDVVLQPVRINAIIGKSMCILEGLLPKSIDLETAFDDPDVTILADTSKIDQVMMNLITNARDAMPQGGKIIIQSKRVTLDEKFRKSHGYGVPAEYVLITVTDTGTGIEKDAQDRIFEPFYTTKKAGKGTGLGLAIVYGIVKQHNGYINVSSKPNKGTAFNVYFPAVKEENPKGSTGYSFNPPNG